MKQKQYDSKILRKKIVDDPLVLDAFAIRFGYREGDLVRPISGEKLKKSRKGQWRSSEEFVRCCWAANRERPIRNGQGRYLTAYECCIVLDVIDSSNGRLTIVLTPEGKQGFILSGDLEKVLEKE